MAVQFNVKIDTKEAAAFLKELGPGVHRAAARAINDTITTVRALGAREIKQQHRALKIGDIKRNMKISKANRLQLTAEVSTAGRPLSLKLFQPTVTPAGVRATIGNVRGLMGSQRNRVFKIVPFNDEFFIRRNGRGVRRFRGPSLPGVFRAASEKFKIIAAARWAVAFPNRLKFEIERARLKARAK